MKSCRPYFAVPFAALFLLIALAFAPRVHAITTITESVRTFAFPQNLQLWERGESVRLLQQFLNAQGFPVAQSGLGSPGNETTLFCLRTYRALITFQTDRGLPATGFLGPLTRNVISHESASFGTTPNHVSASDTAQTPPSTSALPPSIIASSTPPTTPATVCMQEWCPSNGYTPGFGGGGLDTTAPIISGTPSDITAEATSASGATVTYTTPNATDNVDGAIALLCTPVSGSTFVLGTATVTCSATDRAGNSSSSSFTITVQDICQP
jgi:peptidoglycan hydrolase-like protein with peptidoglycan-binding domain